MNCQLIQDNLAEIVPYVRVSTSTLGGHTSIFINLSLDEKDTWINGIFQNSRFAQFSIQEDMKIQEIAGTSKLTKFRKCRVKNEQNVVDKIQQWIDKN